jgi:hypothetical protein
MQQSTREVASFLVPLPQLPFAAAEQDLETTDRWTLHSAVEMQVTMPWAHDVTVRLKQEPHALTAARLGVGACLWEGELFLAAYLGEQRVQAVILTS